MSASEPSFAPHSAQNEHDIDVSTPTSTPPALPPGTVHLVDVDGRNPHGEKHAGGAKEPHDILLVPRPSDDPEDPLNWSFRRKLLATSCVVVYTIMLAIPSSAVYSIVTPIRQATGLSLDNLNNGTGIMVYLLYTSPFPLKIPPRPAGKINMESITHSSSSTAGDASYGSLWRSSTESALRTCCPSRPTSSSSPRRRSASPRRCTAPVAFCSACSGRRWSRCARFRLRTLSVIFLCALFLEPTLLISLQHTDLTGQWFAHERPKYMAWYGWSLALTGKLAPMLSGFINMGMGWKWTLVSSAPHRPKSYIG